MEKPIKNTKLAIVIPVIIGISVCVGVFIGSAVYNQSATPRFPISEERKLTQILRLIEHEYVDTVDVEKLTNDAIETILTDLDPHSSYIPAKDLQVANSQLEGDFEGVGIEFHIANDTIFVVAALSGGPSEKVGIRSGDKIIKVDNEKACGIGLTTNKVFELLRGKKGTEVKITMLRKGIDKLLDFKVIRDKIPTHSVDIHYMLNAETGYIKVSRFAANTHNEFLEALTSLKEKGLKNVIIDLRDNPGGYLDQAGKMADELLPDGAMIVYTNGKQKRYNSSIVASTKGTFETGKVIVLINEGSASASEILSGAVQDNDRGLVVGRRSFGKGLVQMPIPLPDKSELRLTISRYYTPSGRSIQKPYEVYSSDFKNRLTSGELFNKDSIKQNDSLKYFTKKGRIVYGGGGIVPDVFIPQDTNKFSPLIIDLYNNNIISEVSLDVYNNRVGALKTISADTYVSTFKISEAMLNLVKTKAKAKKIKFDNEEWQTSEPEIKKHIRALIARYMWQGDGYYRVMNEGDEFIAESIKLINDSSEYKEILN